MVQIISSIFFLSLGASIRRFQSSMRPVIAVDVTHLKSKYGRVLFVVVCKDENNQKYPLAFCIGDGENNAS